MRILLITPAYRKTSERWMPLSVCYIAAALIARGHQVKIIDRYVLTAKHGIDATHRIMAREIKEFAPDITGFTTVTPVIHDTMEAVKIVRDITASLIVLGGHHATAFPELTLHKIPEADAVIAGEGEESLVMLADNAPPETIPGLYWRGRNFRANPGRGSVVDLDSLPLPAYHLLDMDYYTQPNVFTIRPYYLRVGSVLASRGCKNRCVYCTESLTYAQGLRCHNSDYVADNVELLAKKHRCNGIAFLDNDFLADRNWAEGILKKMIARKLRRVMRFGIQSRVTNIDREIARLLREAGCCKVEFGLETGDAATLIRINKNATTAAAEKTIGILHDNRISVQANLMMGFEGETVEMLDRTLKWVKSLRIDNFKWGMLRIYPGSRLYVDKGHGFVEENEWTRENINGFFAADHLSNISGEERGKWLRTSLEPYKRYLHHRGIWRCNPLWDCMAHYYHALLAKRR